MPNLIYLPKQEELVYHLNQAPKDERYRTYIDNLALSILEYSKQIHQLTDIVGGSI
jgi:hypothetical protein